MSKTTAGLRIAARHRGKFSAPAPPSNVPADVGNDDIGEGGRAPFPLFLLPFAAVDDVLVISADAARDVAAVAVPARHGVGGATLPPDAPPQPLQHRVIRSSRECASKPGKRHFQHQKAQNVHTERAGGGLRESSHCCVFNPVKGREREGGCCNGVGGMVQRRKGGRAGELRIGRADGDEQRRGQTARKGRKGKQLHTFSPQIQFLRRSRTRSPRPP